MTPVELVKQVEVEQSVPEVGKVTLVAPVVVRVNELPPEVIKDEPSAKVRVADVAGAVIATLLTEVAVAAPILGVTSVGEVAKTILPEPVVEFPNNVNVPEVSGKV